ncbi:helix-turn-helix transcriptional regulator [Campylobacter gastrosuis]|uniref:Helix-turn-helix domain-containing protein n=1 Tax=Campylobacter gastrosuis TaxID=2974576 RepID=A0ABT7HNQ5_9BACT|nr:helix-turn-helix domain-containing protein [Campylobacter gastrosuis]MDL0088506.1 helix-turn-helix domain-containing protein [Campylobacter gastrosuis]
MQTQLYPEDLIRPKEAMAILRCNVSTLWQYVKKGYFTKYAPTTRNVFYSRSEILRFIQFGPAKVVKTDE